MRAGAVGAGALALALALGGCLPGGPQPGPGPDGTATATGAAPSPSPVPVPPPPAGEPMDEPKEAVTGAPVPVWDETSRVQARRVSEDAVRAWARPDLPAARWFDELSVFLTPTARRDYQWLQPSSILARKVTAEPEVVDEPSVYLARVDVATDAGTVQVLLSRQDGPTAWLVERIVPPEGQA
ncbi:hypothetical protein [Georgenia daeguensis]|uniref:Lipoprotein n=1 Tax=Georgenia daeguensis TaxID=908355 RepID=A0ABP8EXB3_9MICO